MLITRSKTIANSRYISVGEFTSSPMHWAAVLIDTRAVGGRGGWEEVARGSMNTKFKDHVKDPASVLINYRA